MIGDNRPGLGGFERATLRIARILVRGAIHLQIGKFQSSSRAKRRAMAAAIAVIELSAEGLGLILQAGDLIVRALTTGESQRWRPQAFEGTLAAFASPGAARGNGMSAEEV
jgi:hypothetical protein